jgi:hypothetical protein
MRHWMTKSLPYFAVLIVAGCSSVSQPSVTRLASDDRPPFNDANNIAEYYGRCPKCSSWTKGYLIQTLYAPDDGKSVCESSYTSDCPKCGAHLDCDALLVSDARIVTLPKK